MVAMRSSTRCSCPMAKSTLVEILHRGSSSIKDCVISDLKKVFDGASSQSLDTNRQLLPTLLRGMFEAAARQYWQDSTTKLPFALDSSLHVRYSPLICVDSAAWRHEAGPWRCVGVAGLVSDVAAEMERSALQLLPEWVMHRRQPPRPIVIDDDDHQLPGSEQPGGDATPTAGMPAARGVSDRPEVEPATATDAVGGAVCESDDPWLDDALDVARLQQLQQYDQLRAELERLEVENYEAVLLGHPVSPDVLHRINSIFMQLTDYEQPLQVTNPYNPMLTIEDHSDAAQAAIATATASGVAGGWFGAAAMGANGGASSSAAAAAADHGQGIFRAAAAAANGTASTPAADTAIGRGSRGFRAAVATDVGASPPAGCSSCRSW